MVNLHSKTAEWTQTSTHDCFIFHRTIKNIPSCKGWKRVLRRHRKCHRLCKQTPTLILQPLGRTPSRTMKDTGSIGMYFHPLSVRSSEPFLDDFETLRQLVNNAKLDSAKLGMLSVRWIWAIWLMFVMATKWPSNSLISFSSINGSHIMQKRAVVAKAHLQHELHSASSGIHLEMSVDYRYIQHF